jgi:hypothetical protein
MHACRDTSAWDWKQAPRSLKLKAPVLSLTLLPPNPAICNWKPTTTTSLLHNTSDEGLMQDAHAWSVVTDAPTLHFFPTSRNCGPPPPTHLCSQVRHHSGQNANRRRWQHASRARSCALSAHMLLSIMTDLGHASPSLSVILLIIHCTRFVAWCACVVLFQKGSTDLLAPRNMSNSILQVPAIESDLLWTVKTCVLLGVIFFITLASIMGETACPFNDSTVF